MAEKNIVQETFPVLGMSCASCSARVEKTLNHQSGVKKAVVNYASATATVEYDPTSCSSETLQQAVQAAGYDLLINQDGNTLEEAEEAARLGIRKPGAPDLLYFPYLFMFYSRALALLPLHASKVWKTFFRYFALLYTCLF